MLEALRESEPLPPLEAALLRGAETVLVAEDDQDVRHSMVQVLKTFGYQTLVAQDGPEALLVDERHDGPIHLLLTDVVMPGASGHQLGRQLSLERPDLKVLYMSGYTDNAIVHHGVLDPDATLLEKPFSAEGLARKVREVLDGD